MIKVIFLQLALALCAVVLAALMWGSRGAASAALGALACVLPNALFVWRLVRSARRAEVAQASSQAVAFLVGEALKLVSIIGLLVAVWLLYPGAQWGAVLLGIVLTLQANFLALRLKF